MHALKVRIVAVVALVAAWWRRERSELGVVLTTVRAATTWRQFGTALRCYAAREHVEVSAYRDDRAGAVQAAKRRGASMTLRLRCECGWHSSTGTVVDYHEGMRALRAQARLLGRE